MEREYREIRHVEPASVEAVIELEAHAIDNGARIHKLPERIELKVGLEMNRMASDTFGQFMNSSARTYRVEGRAGDEPNGKRTW